MNDSIMPLVEENRKLHAENTLLREELAKLSVRLDTLMETPINYKNALRHVTVEVDPMLVHLEPRDRWAKITRDLVEKLLDEVPTIARKTQMVNGKMELLFAFVSWGKK